MSTPWANYDGIIDFLRELIEVEKASFSDAAFEINKRYGTSISRMACIGQARRKGIVVAPERINSGARKPYKPRTRIHGGLINQIKAKLERPPIPEYPVIIMDDDIPLEQRKTIFDLTNWTCRWPIGDGFDMFFCGAVPLAGCPYCAGHSARAYKGNNSSPSNVARLKRAA